MIKVVLLCSVASLSIARPQAIGAENYLASLQNALAHARASLAATSASAERAAKEYVAGGNLYVAGRQPDFIAETCGRAGGLMTIAPLGQQVPRERDVVLYAVRGDLDANDTQITKEWEKKGAMVVRFNSGAGLFRERFPLDTVVNAANLWTWTGEFVASCTRLGKMPVLYQSYGLPGGPERGKKYQGKRFHDDLAIQPIPAGILGRAYLYQIERMLAVINTNQMPKLAQAAKWWQAVQSSSTTTLVTGHMFPAHGQDPRIPRLTRFAAVPAWEDKDLLARGDRPSLVFYIGYQLAPRKLLEQAKASGVKLVYDSVQPADPPEPAPNILYVAPGWPLTDACVNVPGYDIPILPASGVVQAAIFWAIASERDKLGRF